MDAAKNGENAAKPLLDAACFRSFRRSFPAWRDGLEGAISIIQADGGLPAGFRAGRKNKIIAFGAPEKGDLQALGLEHDKTLPSLAGADNCESCEVGLHHTESPGYVDWTSHPLAENLGRAILKRPFVRYDFTTEWNNLGFGRITTDDSIWSVRGGWRTAGQELAGIYIKDHDKPLYAGAYMALLDLPDASILWCARPVGPLDSVEWSVIENFVSSWRPDDLPCWPALRQTPAGCNVVAAMRLDCDEDISSARDVLEWYLSRNLPFSLAVKTCLPMTPEHLAMLKDAGNAGASLLSHSHNHEYGWGADYEKALLDAKTSRQWFADNLPEFGVPANAVSPFHSNPAYAVQAVNDAGFTGMISGIIHNDPEFLLGRAGRAPLINGGLNSVSEQSMLHGDCFRAQGNVDTHIDAFELQHKAKGFFGWLDHPFSSRYQYGWESKSQRLAAHEALVEALAAFDNVLFWNQSQCFDYLALLDGVSFEVEGGKARASSAKQSGEYKPAYVFQGEERVIG